MVDDHKDIRWMQRFSNLLKAYSQLSDFPDLEHLNKFEKQGLIQSFEYTFELAWKTLQDLLKEKGFKNVIGPRAVIETSFQYGLIQDGEGWMEVLKDRNRTTHTYQEEVMEDIAAKVSKEYILLFERLTERLKDEEGT